MIIKQFLFNIADSSEAFVQILKIINKIDFPRHYFYKALIASYKYFGINYNYHIKTYFKFFNLKQNGIDLISNKCVKCFLIKNIIYFDFDIGDFLCTNKKNY